MTAERNGDTGKDRSGGLDEEGIPDLEGPLPSKEETGDAQEGLAPPHDRATAALDTGTTAAEQLAGETLDERVAREEPDDDADTGDLEAGEEEPEGRDEDDDLLRRVGPGEGAPSAEEAAVTVRDEDEET